MEISSHVTDPNHPRSRSPTPNEGKDSGGAAMGEEEEAAAAAPSVPGGMEGGWESTAGCGPVARPGVAGSSCVGAANRVAKGSSGWWGAGVVVVSETAGASPVESAMG